MSEELKDKIDMAFIDSILLEAGFVFPKHLELERKGWREWLMTLFPFWFSSEFSPDHEDYWNLRWDTLMQIKNGETPDPQKMAVMLLLGRGLGKSAIIEASRIMRGALLNGGYSLIASETDDQAQEHLGNCRILIEHPESRLVEYYPDMAITDNSDVVKGMPTADRKEMFICKNGYIVRAKGLAAKMRGLRVGVQRPNDLALDDIDDVNDSLMVSQNKLRLIAASIFPVLARDNPTIDVGQNLISEHSVINQIFTGKSDVLAERTVIGPTKAFTDLQMETWVDDTGKVRHTILPTSQTSWVGLNLTEAQRFLNNSGLAAFMAEYQNEFDQYKAGRVIPEFDEDRQIITWSQFEEVYGERRIPSHWSILAGLDVGYSDGSHPHYSAWVFIATSAMNSRLPGKLFVYRARSFRNISIDDQAETIKSEMWPGEFVYDWQMSHERTGEMMTLNQKYELPFRKFRHYKAEDGVAQWRHLSRPDKKKPYPFGEDELEGDSYLLGQPSLYYIVDDDQARTPRDDKGMKLLREQVSTWEYVPVKITETGQTAQKPSKINDDFCDTVKGILAYFGANPTELTKEEQFIQRMPEQYKSPNLDSDDRRRRNLWIQKQIRDEQNKVPTSLRGAMRQFDRLRGR